MWRTKNKKHREPLIVNLDGTEKEIYDYKVSVDCYTPGERVGNDYVSEYYGIRFSASADWEYVSDEWLEKFTKDKKKTEHEAFLESLEERGINTDSIREWVETLYLEVEMCACYNKDGKTHGDVEITVFDPIDSDETSAMYASGIAQVLSGISENVTCKKRKLCGKKYDTVNALVRGENVAMSVRSYCRKEGNMLIEIRCRAYEGHEYVLDEIEKRMSRIPRNGLWGKKRKVN